MADERWFTVAEIAHLLRVHEQTVRVWLKSGRLRGKNFGGKTGWRIPESSLQDFLALNGESGKAAA